MKKITETTIYASVLLFGPSRMKNAISFRTIVEALIVPRSFLTGYPSEHIMRWKPSAGQVKMFKSPAYAPADAPKLKSEQA